MQDGTTTAGDADALRKKLDKRIEQFTFAVPVIIALILGCYVAVFVVRPCMTGECWPPLWVLGSLDANDWGPFGDFFGGILNPIVAAAALYWLIRSVQIQQVELAATNSALVDSAKSQNELVAQSIAQLEVSREQLKLVEKQNEQSKVLAKINAFNVLIQAASAEIEALREELAPLSRAVNEPYPDMLRVIRDYWGEILSAEEALRKLKDLQSSLNLMEVRREQDIQELRGLLRNAT